MAVEEEEPMFSHACLRSHPGSVFFMGSSLNRISQALSIYLSPLWQALPGKLCFLFLLFCLQVSLYDLEAIPWRWWTHRQALFPRVLCGTSTQANVSCRMCIRKKFLKQALNYPSIPTNSRVLPKQTPSEAVQRAGREKQDLSSSQKKNKAWLGT